MTVALGLAAFGGGTWLLVESVEGLVKTVRAWALAAGLSGMLLSALVLGLDLESTATGVAASLDGLPGAALGASVGAAIFLVTFGLGIAAVSFPFEVRTPRPLLIAPAAGTALAIGLAADGSLSRVDGALLLAAFGPLLALVVSALRQRDRPRTELPERLVLRLLAALAGIVAGAELLVFGTQKVVTALDLSETVFGLLAVAAAVSLEEVVLEMLPAYRGFPELTVGNALGTLLFLLTGSLGVIALAHPVEVSGTVRGFHLPALAVAVALALGLLARGRLGRPQGALLVTGYLGYAIATVIVA